MTAGGVPPSFKTQTNTQTVAGDTRPVAFFLPPFHIFAYHFTPDLFDWSVPPPAERQRRLVEEGGTGVGAPGPRRQEQMLGGWHLAESSQTLITALNC